MRIIGLAAILSGLWLLLSGHYDALFLFFGACSVALAVYIAVRMELVDEEGLPVHLTPAAMRYWPWLAWQVVASNLDVARRIVHPRLPIDPVVGRVKAGQRTALGKVVYANSITLTPGTVSIDVAGDTIVVHALTSAAFETLQRGEMDRRVTAMTERRR